MRTGKAAWLYGCNLILLLAGTLFVAATIFLLTNPLFVLIPIQKYDPYVLGYCVIDVCLAILCATTIVATRQRKMVIVIFCHWVTCCTIVVDAIMVFVLANLMATVHLSLNSHIQVLHENSKEFCSIWTDSNPTLTCCPPKEIFELCAEYINATRINCPTDHSNDCYVHIMQWLHSYTELVAAAAFGIMVPVKVFMIVALRKDIEKVEIEMAELEYYSQMLNDYDKHGDGYIESFKSNANLAESTSTQSSRVSRVRSFPGYSPFLKHSVIEEVENEFTVRGDEIREELQRAIAEHNARQLEPATFQQDEDE